MSTVAITRNDSIDQAIVEALGYIDMEPLVRGKLVAVKPNDTSWAALHDNHGNALSLEHP